MTETAFVLIICDSANAESLKSEISKINEVQDVIMTVGPHNIIVKINSTSEKLRDVITWKIRKLSSVTSTLTLMKNQ